MSQNGPKPTLLMRSLTKNPQPPTKNFFRVQSRRLAESLRVCHQDHSIIACSCQIHMVLFFEHIPLVVKHAFSTKPAEWLQHNQAGHAFPTCHAIHFMCVMWPLLPILFVQLEAK